MFNKSVIFLLIIGLCCISAEDSDIKESEPEPETEQPVESISVRQVVEENFRILKK